MSEEWQKAESLEEVWKCVSQQPLQPGDPRYVSIPEGRDSNAVTKLRICVEDHDARANRFAKVVFLGHRGCGKTTELYRLEHELKARFTSLHLTPDDSLLPNLDYTDLLLWLVGSLVQRCAQEKVGLNHRLAEEAVQWFAEVSLENVTSVRKQVEVETDVETRGKLGVFWFSLQMLARLKAMVTGDVERRKTVRQRLQSYSTDLVRKVNLLLDDARRALADGGQAPDLLIVQDNLDRLPIEAARRLFFDYGDLLKSLRAHVVLTAPIPMLLAPWNIGAVFENTFTMPMVKVHTERGGDFAKGIADLTRLVEGRLVVPRIFTVPGIVRFLVKMSGGSMRDVVRILNYAQLEARTDRKPQIDWPSARKAVRALQQDYERLLIPADVYYPFLVQVFQNKREWMAAGKGEVHPDSVRAARLFFSELLINGSVLEYNGAKVWYDVHPVLWNSDPFKHALENATSPKPNRAP